MVPEPTTAELVLAAAGGEQTAWEILVERYSGLVWAVVRAHRMPGHDAADVVQTVWLRLVEHLDRLREPEHLGGWLGATARHEALRVLRRSLREQPDDDIDNRREAARLDHVTSPESAVLSSERGEELVAAFKRLPERCRVLLSLLATDPTPSYAEVATALDMPIGSIGPTRGRCLSRLRELLPDTTATATT
jgi:RNA polymerase sigma factor (sigma-70 family)